MKNSKKEPCRVIDLIGVVDDNMLAMFTERMREICSYDFELYEYNYKLQEKYKIPYEPIRINLATPGGSVTAGVGIMSVMDEAIAPIHVHVMGNCMSMGISILAHADTRSANPFASFMIHGMATGTWGYLDEGIDSLAYYKELEKKLNIELTKRTKYTLEELENYSNVAHFFGYEEALDKGLLTKDIYKKDQNPRFTKQEFKDVIMDDYEHGMSIDDIINAFEKDELYDCEWDIVLDLLVSLEECIKEANDILAKEEDDDNEIADAELDDTDEINEDVDDNDIVEYEELAEFVDGEGNHIKVYQADVEEFISEVSENYDTIHPLLQGDYTAAEIATFLQAEIEFFADLDLDYIINMLILLNEEDEEDENME